MPEELEGKGILRRLELPTEEWQVDYRFAIATAIRQRAGFPRVAARRYSSGTVSASDGKVIPEGYYELSAQDGETLRVKNLGLDQWAILAPL
jgi:hypothetical protein